MFISAMKMTDSHTSIESSGSDYNSTTAQVDTAVSAINEPVQEINGTNGGFESEPTNIPFVIKAPIANSKLILQNMEEVLNSVKKKHRQKHRRKREQKKLAQIEAEEAGLNRISNKPESKKFEKSEKKHKKKPLQEKSALENDLIHTKTKNKYQKSPLKSVSNESILNHFSRTPKKSDNVESDVISNNKNETPSVNEIKKTNAFEVLMNARNKSIGSNSPGKEVSEVSVCEVDVEKSAIKIKRKLLLEDWADKKGASKRRADEEMREEYIEQEMKHRAKRLKKMLTNGHTPKSSPVSRLKENHKANDGLSQSPHAVTPTSTSKERVKRKSRIRKRLESLESEESLNGNKKLDEETMEFLSKLNSPTKKRDSLLGYFSKKESPKDSLKKEVETTKTKEDKQFTPKINQKRNSKRRTPIEINSSNNIKQTNEKLAEEQCITPSGRPKRSCADKARYDYDLEVDDINIEISNKANNSRSKATKFKDDRDDIVEVINLDESSTNETPTQTPKKLAPVFVRSIPKPPPDPEVLKARKEFLMSGLPEKIRLEWAKQKQQELIYEESIELFPKVAHVQQFDANDLSLVQYKAFEIKLRADTDNDSIKNSNRKSKSKSRSSIGNLTSCTIQDFRTISKCNINDAMRNVKLQSLPVLQNKIKIVKLWKSKFLNFPTYKCYNQLREKYRYFSAIDSAQNTEQVTESFVVTRRTTRTKETKNNFDDSTEYKPPSAAPNGELLFNEKYRPMLFEQVLVNLTPITQLRDFLSNWSDSNSSSVRSSQAFDDSVDFVNDSNSSPYGVCNTMVLLGPISSGKTSAVFALANEMNFNVLEINAGMKRTGKKLIQELQEATQSHQIRKEASAGHIKSKQKLLKMSLKKQNSQTFDSDSCNNDLNINARKSLILIEDADIVFEQTDAGFTDAIYTLAASSKRPVVIIASNANCQHLQRLMNQNMIQFSSPNTLSISKFFSVLSLIENCPIDVDEITSLYIYNRKDVRKTINELQFFIQSGGDAQEQTQKSKDKRLADQKTDQNKQYFASPEKRKYSQDTNTLCDKDDNLGSNTEIDAEVNEDMDYLHKKIFHFYTVDQNVYRNIPFPIDFDILHFNIKNILQISKNVQNVTNDIEVDDQPKPTRKSRTPKKSSLKKLEKSVQKADPLSYLTEFYKNISIATQIGDCNGNNLLESYIIDRQVEYLTEHITHDLVDRSIEQNLNAKIISYNTFHEPRTGYSVSKYLSTNNIRTQRARSLDFEPALRSICRSEKLRSSMERRSTRFYHYLRNASTNMCNFSTNVFDAACDVLQEQDTESEMET